MTPLQAARNNAEWCAAMTRSHGQKSHFSSQAWTVSSRAPLYYPDAVTLAPNADVTALLKQIDTKTPGASVKDSFADLDLTPAGFQILFEAQWIHRSPGAAPKSNLAWTRVDTPTSLHEWALAWPFVLDATHQLFPGHPVLGYEHGDDLTAALNHGFEPIGPLRVWLHH